MGALYIWWFLMIFYLSSLKLLQWTSSRSEKGCFCALFLVSRQSMFGISGTLRGLLLEPFLDAAKWQISLLGSIFTTINASCSEFRFGRFILNKYLICNRNVFFQHLLITTVYPTCRQIKWEFFITLIKRRLKIAGWEEKRKISWA